MRRWYLDLHPDNPNCPQIGDVLVTTRAEYPVVDVWPTESRVWSNRWTLTLGERAEKASHAATGGTDYGGAALPGEPYTGQGTYTLKAALTSINHAAG